MSIDVNAFPELDYARIARDQIGDNELATWKSSSSTALEFQLFDVLGSASQLWCDVSCGKPRPFIPRSWRAAVKEDLQCSPAELVYGESLRLPGEFCGDFVKDGVIGENEFLDTLRSTVSKFLAFPPRTPDNQRCFVPSALDSAEYVWVRQDGHRRPLQRPYNGPFKVISKSTGEILLVTNLMKLLYFLLILFQLPAPTH
ncbi:hypothetical protein Pmani_007308 [Petrolisthes manimaculis]|uniref:Uncharacterized protein n=1 Tax=Petrolisthes manimaculis TaxID=1843537 RepID=A0AAE1Q906_9EUCA|nr:hypothetical protein Pmani_007308 [Petrolisthes manimaculis]